jgi:Abortive infection C-terminus
MLWEGYLFVRGLDTAALCPSRLNDMFMAAGFPGDVPEGNKSDKVRAWLGRANKECDEPLALFGQVIAEFMDVEPHPAYIEQQGGDPRDKIHAALAKEGLSYQRGGNILGAALSGPSKSLGELLKNKGVHAIEVEYDRAYKTIEADPAAAVRAACAILESTCKWFLESEGHTLPNRQVLAQLWSAVADRLGLTPKVIADEDLKRILQGLFSIADGIAALRTHAGSAHGHSPGRSYRLAPRHARLAVHAAHTMTLFLFETWENRGRRS